MYLKQALPTGVMIYGDKVATIIWGDIPIAFVINSKQNAESYKGFFEDLWKKAER